MNDIEALRCLVAEQLPPGGIEQLAAAAAFDRIEADLAAMTARAEAAEKLRQIAAAKIQELMALADEYGRYCNSAGIEGAVPQTFSEWLAQQRAVQP